MLLAGFRHTPAAPAGVPAIGRPEPRARFIAFWTVLGSLVPGLGYLRAGRTVLGRVVLAAVLSLAAAAVWAVLAADPVRFVESVAVSPVKLAWTAGIAVVLAGLWGLLVLTTHVAVRRSAALPLAPSTGCAVLVMALVAAGALPATATAASAMIARQTPFDLFTSNARPSLAAVQQPMTAGPEVPPSAVQGPADPWAAVPRVNVLLIGSDAGADRTGVRPDTLVVASIDT